MTATVALVGYPQIMYIHCNPLEGQIIAHLALARQAATVRGLRGLRGLYSPFSHGYCLYDERIPISSITSHTVAF